jgi:hypothetical protein
MIYGDKKNVQQFKTKNHHRINAINMNKELTTQMDDDTDVVQYDHKNVDADEDQNDNVETENYNQHELKSKMMGRERHVL